MLLNGPSHNPKLRHNHRKGVRSILPPLRLCWDTYDDGTTNTLRLVAAKFLQRMLSTTECKQEISKALLTMLDRCQAANPLKTTAIRHPEELSESRGKSGPLWPLEWVWQGTLAADQHCPAKAIRGQHPGRMHDIRTLSLETGVKTFGVCFQALRRRGA